MARYECQGDFFCYNRPTLNPIIVPNTTEADVSLIRHVTQRKFHQVLVLHLILVGTLQLCTHIIIGPVHRLNIYYEVAGRTTVSLICWLLR